MCSRASISPLPAEGHFHQLPSLAERGRWTCRSLSVVENSGERQETSEGTALHFALLGRFLVGSQIVEAFLEAGADADARNSVNQTCRDMLAEISEFLEEASKETVTEYEKLKLEVLDHKQEKL